jgi:chorismate mutase
MKTPDQIGFLCVICFSVGAIPMVMFIKNLGHVTHMSLETLRDEITKVDAHIIRLIAQRQDLAGKIAQVKIHGGLPVHDKQRTSRVLEDAFNLAVESKIDPVAVQKIFEILISMSEERQRGFSGEGNLP